MLASPPVKNIAVAGMATTVAISGVLVLSGSTPAFADPGTAPACIQRSVSDDGTQWHANIHNGCGRTMRVQVHGTTRWQNGACHTLAPGQGYQTETHNRHLGGYGRTLVC